MSDDAEAIEAFFKRRRQGDVFVVPAAIDPLVDDSDKGDSQWVVISQTCDVVRSKTPTVTLAKVNPPPAHAVDMARGGAMPRFIPLPSLDGGSFADMAEVHSFRKEALVGCEIMPEIVDASNADRRSLALAITRWFGRFPFPDNVAPWLKPLEDQIRKKYTRQGALGQVLREHLVEVRVEADWAAAEPLHLLLHVIAKASAIPLVDSPSGSLNPNFMNSLYGANGQVLDPSAIAQVFLRASDPLERSAALSALSESFASICQRAGQAATDPAVVGAVSTGGCPGSC